VSNLISDEDVKTQRRKWLREVLGSMQSFEAKERPSELYETVDLLVKMGALPGGDSYQMMRHVVEELTAVLGREPGVDDVKGRALSDLLAKL
jgi:hypothetical protein